MGLSSYRRQQWAINRPATSLEELDVQINNPHQTGNFKGLQPKLSSKRQVKIIPHPELSVAGFPMHIPS